MRFTLAAVVSLVAIFMVACSGGSEGSVPNISSVRAERVIEDGEAKLKSKVTVEFDRTFELAPSKVPLASNFEFDLPAGSGAASRRVLVQSAAVSTLNPREVNLEVETLIPDGATLRVAKKTFQVNATGDLSAQVKSELSPALMLLASRELGLRNAGLLDSPVTAAVSERDRDAAAMRETLAEHLAIRGANQETTNRALARYDGLPAEIITSPKLRAALAGLTGTFAEPAIDSLVTANNCTGKVAARVVFQPPPNAPDLIARVTFTRGGQRVISINPVAEGERIEHLMPILAHEAVHCDNEDGRSEEIIATAFDAFLYLQFVAADPSLVKAGTVLARELNIDGIAMLNSGRRLPESAGILPSAGVTRALPGTNVQHASFAELVVAAYPGIDTQTSAAEPVAEAYVNNLVAAAGMQPGSSINLRYLDELLGRAIAPEVLLRAITAFDLGM